MMTGDSTRGPFRRFRGIRGIMADIGDITGRGGITILHGTGILGTGTRGIGIHGITAGDGLTVTTAAGIPAGHRFITITET